MVLIRVIIISFHFIDENGEPSMLASRMAITVTATLVNI